MEIKNPTTGGLLLLIPAVTFWASGLTGVLGLRWANPLWKLSNLLSVPAQILFILGGPVGVAINAWIGLRHSRRNRGRAELFARVVIRSALAASCPAMITDPMASPVMFGTVLHISRNRSTPRMSAIPSSGTLMDFKTMINIMIPTPGTGAVPMGLIIVATVDSLCNDSMFCISTGVEDQSTVNDRTAAFRSAGGSNCQRRRSMGSCRGWNTSLRSPN